MIKVHESVYKRIEVVKDAASRSRYASGAITLAASLIIIAVVSSYLSWMHAFALNPTFDPIPKVPTDVLQRRLLEEWVASQFVSIPILGIKISVSEVSLFGPLILLILFVWQYFSARREHFAIARLLNDLYFDFSESAHLLVFEDASGKETSKLSVRRHMRQILHIVSNQLVFITIASDRPIAWREPESAASTGTERSIGGTAVRVVLWFLKYLPIFTIAFAALTDVFTFDVARICVGAAFRSTHSCIKWSDLGSAEHNVAYTMCASVGIGFVGAILVSIALARYSRATSEVLRGFRDFCHSDENREPSAGNAPPPPKTEG